MIRTQFGTWIWSPYDPRLVATVIDSPIRQIDITLSFWNLLWAAYPEIDVTADMIGEKEPRIVGMQLDWKIPGEFMDMRLDMRSAFLWTPEDTLQLLKFQPTKELIERLKYLYMAYKIPINHSLEERLSMPVGEDSNVELPNNVVNIFRNKS